MKTVILDSRSANLSLAQFLEEIGDGGAQLLDSVGNVIVFVVPPSNDEAFVYAETERYLSKHKEDIQRALNRRGGITTAQLLERAHAAALKVEGGTGSQ
ncbi:MAG: hypothetical protein IT425_00710 [Pirellulales bacterium]|nr:hypothetical protein [Pirellulales bacterium]